MKDASGNLAPIVYSRKQDFSASLRGLDKVSEAEKTERERLSAGGMENTGETVPVERPVRGYGKGYEIFADDLHTDVDVDKLVHDMKRSGIKVCSMLPQLTPLTAWLQDIYASMDAGHYLCDFIFFGSLAENKRRVSPDERPHQVLFLHCPPVNQPHSTDEVTEAIRRIVVWVCSELQSADTFNGLSQ
jgi:pyroglutamyl-peptidase